MFKRKKRNLEREEILFRIAVMCILIISTVLNITLMFSDWKAPTIHLVSKLGPCPHNQIGCYYNGNYRLGPNKIEVALNDGWYTIGETVIHEYGHYMYHKVLDFQDRKEFKTSDCATKGNWSYVKKTYPEREYYNEVFARCISMYYSGYAWQDEWNATFFDKIETNYLGG